MFIELFGGISLREVSFPYVHRSFLFEKSEKTPAMIGRQINMPKSTTVKISFVMKGFVAWQARILKRSRLRS